MTDDTGRPACRVCGQGGEFGYFHDTEVGWYCVEHRLGGPHWAEARIPYDADAIVVSKIMRDAEHRRVDREQRRAAREGEETDATEGGQAA